MKGRIIGIEDHGTIVQVWIATEDNREIPVNFDHRMFQAFYENEKPLEGKTIDCHAGEDSPIVEVI